jgi:hypothetical protein
MLAYPDSNPRTRLISLESAKNNPTEPDWR